MFFLFFPIKKSFCEQDSGCWKEKRKENEEASMLSPLIPGVFLALRPSGRTVITSKLRSLPLSPLVPLCVKGIFRDGLQVSLI